MRLLPFDALVGDTKEQQMSLEEEVAYAAQLRELYRGSLGELIDRLPSGSKKWHLAAQEDLAREA